MTTFDGIERRIRSECKAIGERKAEQLVRLAASSLGFNTDSAWWRIEDFRAAIQPLKIYAAKRFADREFNRVWDDAEKAALDVLKKGAA